MSSEMARAGFLASGQQAARDREKEWFISAALHLPGNAITYEVNQRLTALYPDRTVLETDSSSFEIEEYARAGQCAITHRVTPHGERVTDWYSQEHEHRERLLNAWLDVEWQGHRLETLVLHVDDDRWCYIVADTRDVAQRFFTAVCEWDTEVRGEVLVFERGRWKKDEDLFAAIKGARFDNLVLRGTLKEEILGDVARFFASRDTYEAHAVPWKRGILFAGPPGNGKTHAVKALINATEQPCLYVKSFRQRETPDEYGMRTVFERARASAPAILVLEDLDALVTEDNRSFFLNEMDGFAANGGILTLATSNHPERLDAAITQRPSRFDRTYRFELPTVLEREVFVARYNESLQPATRLSMATVANIAEWTEGFSFAYLKELFLSALLRWMDNPTAGAMEAVMREQVSLLRDQMHASAASTTPAPTGTGD